MRRDVADLWIEALRSGNYPQTRGALRRTKLKPVAVPAGYCCMGVLCEIALIKGDIGLTAVEDTGMLFYNGENAVLPDAVVVWAGLESSTGFGPARPALTELNDGGSDFNEIAGIIDKEWETL